MQSTLKTPFKLKKTSTAQGRSGSSRTYVASEDLFESLQALSLKEDISLNLASAARRVSGHTALQSD